MAKYTGSKCRLCRREGVKLFLKGAKCESEKCPLLRKQQAPGQHGTSRRRPSDYGLQLREKQKVKRIYGILERQFRRYLKEARGSRGKTGLVLLQILESRLDNIVYRLGIGLSRSHARQLVRHGKILVDGKKVDIPSYRVKVGEKVSLAKKGPQLKEVIVPEWLKWDKRKKEGKVLAVPERDQIEAAIDESLIVEFYSR